MRHKAKPESYYYGGRWLTVGQYQITKSARTVSRDLKDVLLFDHRHRLKCWANECKISELLDPFT